MTDDMELVRGSGNVFRDLGCADADREQLRALLAAQIIGVLDERKLTVRAADTVAVEGATYEVEPELAGETVTLWWGLFDQDLFVEFEGRRLGPYQPSRGAIPLYRYRKYQKSRAEERLDRVVQHADQLGLPRAAVSGGDRSLPSLPSGAGSISPRRMAFLVPPAHTVHPTPLAAKRAIAAQLSRPLGGLPEADLTFINDLVGSPRASAKPLS